MPALKKIGFAVVGLGSIARDCVVPAFKNAKKAKLVALVSRDKSKAQQWARKYKVPKFYARSEYDACLANPDVHALYISTPQGDHEGLTTRAAKARKHVLCEKPLAATQAQSAAMVSACREHGVMLMTAYRKYFEPSTVYLKKLIQNGSLGRIDMIHTAFSELHIAGKSLSWLVDPKMAGGGPLMDLGVYCINNSRWLVNEDPTEVSAESWRHDAQHFREVEEGITFRMKFASGLVVQGASTYGSVLSSFIFVQGTKGWLCLSPSFPFDKPRRLTGEANGELIDKKFKVVDEFAPQIDAFAQAVQRKRKVEPTGEQGHKDMIILSAIYEAAKKRTPIRINYQDRGQNIKLLAQGEMR
jgi:predicted dehydrogenase